MSKSKFVKMQQSFSGLRIANDIYSCRLDDPRDNAEGLSNMVLYYDITSAKKALIMMSNLMGGKIDDDQMKLSHPNWSYSLNVSQVSNSNLYIIKPSAISKEEVRRIVDSFRSELFY